MKLAKLSALSLSIAAVLAGPSAIAQTATTDPVGFLTQSLVAGTGSAPGLTLISPTLTKPIEWQGASLSITSTTITVPGVPGPWSAGQFNPGANGEYYVEVVGATNPGALSDISGTATNSITIDDDLTSFWTAGASIKIRKHMTIADIFGATNSAGLISTDEAATSDEVIIYDGAIPESYFYYTGVEQPVGWYNSSSGAPSTNQVIKPHQGIVVKRKGGGVKSVTAVGSVKTGNTLIPVVPGVNVLGTVSAKGLTLDNSGLDATPFFKSDEAAVGDEVVIYTGSTPTNYFYYTGTEQSPGWYDSSSGAPAGPIPISPGSAFVIARKGGRAAFNWSLPSPNSF